MRPPMRLVSLVAATVVVATACATSVQLEVEAPQPADLGPSPAPEGPVASTDTVRAAIAALDEYSSFQVTLDMDTGIERDDLDISNVVRVDRVSGIFEWRLRLTGEDWRDRVGSDASGRALVDSTFRYVGDGVGPLYFTLDPLPSEANQAKPWVELTSAQLGLAGGVNAVALDPRAAVSDFPFLEGDLGDLESLGRDEIGGEEMDHYRISAPHAALVNYLPGSLAQALVDDGLSSSSFVGSTIVDFWIDDQSALRRLVIPYEAFIAEAIELGSGAEFDGLELALDFQFDSFDEALGLELPPAELVDLEADLSGGQVLPPVTVSGECYSEEELFFADGSPVACTESHVAEIYAVTVLEEPVGADWPGLEAIQDRASTFCNDEFGRVMGVPGEISALDVLFFRPDQETWRVGDREVACFVQFPVPISQPMTAFDPMREFGLVSSYQLAIGDCLADRSLVEEVALTAVDCSTEHWFEIYASKTIEADSYPGEDAVLGDADEFCAMEFQTFVGVSYSGSSLLIENLWPTAESWELWGDRLISCAITSDVQRTASAAGTRN